MPMTDALTFLKTRRSRPAKIMTGPVPGKEALEALLVVAARTPDHGKLEPWRFIVLEQAALRRLGVLTRSMAEAAGPEPDAIAIGNNAGYANQAANSIVLNATGNILNNIVEDAFIVKPIRNDTMTTILGYDAGTGEVTHNAAIPGYISLADLKTEVAASADFAAFKVRIAAL